MAKGKIVGRIKRKPKKMYFVDGAGAVREISLKKRKKKKRSG